MFLQRFLTATVLLCAFVAALFLLPPTYWMALLAPGLLLAGIEWARLAGYSRSGHAFFAAVLLLSYFVLIDAVAVGGNARVSGAGPTPIVIYAVATAFWLIAAPAWMIAGWRVRQRWLMGATGWLVLVPTWIALAEMQANPAQLVFVMAVVWIADTAAYLVGRSIGRRRLAPLISPGKTWEGVAGSGLAVAVYYALAYLADIPEGSLWRGAGGLVVVAAVAVLSIEGDLFESCMKRQAGVKDSGSVLPGHGGLLDRIDGLTASLPVAALLIAISSANPAA